ncbi:MAG TPA: CopD family protein [Gallionella sp.]
MMLSKLVHLLAVLIWVGGMFFAYVVLRPAAVEVLEPPLRLRLWDNVFRRFFVWVWGAIAVILASGFYMIYLLGGFAQVSHFVHVMLLSGLAMVAIYVYVYFAGYRRLSALVAGQSWQEAGAMLGRIRKLIAVNLTLGLLTVGIAVLGLYM